jgi:hypothetical protein
MISSWRLFRKYLTIYSRITKIYGWNIILIVHAALILKEETCKTISLEPTINQGLKFITSNHDLQFKVWILKTNFKVSL